MKRGISLLLVLGLVLLSACTSSAEQSTLQSSATVETPMPTGEGAVRTLRVMTHDSFDIGEEVLGQFEAQHNVRVEILQAGDAGVVLNQAILSADNPMADVLYGVDNTLLSRALNADIFEPYSSPLLSQIPGDLALDPEHRVLPVDYGDVCLNYDKAWFEEHGLTPPTSLDDLVREDYRALTVVENAASSSPGLAFMLATIGRYGESGDYTWLDYWADLRDNDVLIVEGWEDAYWGQFTYGSGGEGDRPIVVSYASSPPVEVLFAEEELDEAPTAALIADDTCFRQVEFVGILRGTENRDLAEAWIDAMLDTAFQEDIPLHMFMFPANQNAQLPQVFVDFATIAERPVSIDYVAIEANRETWLSDWTAVALQ